MRRDSEQTGAGADDGADGCPIVRMPPREPADGIVALASAMLGAGTACHGEQPALLRTIRRQAQTSASAYGFPQIPPHDGHPGLPLTAPLVGPIEEDLQPSATAHVPVRVHAELSAKKTSPRAKTLRGPVFCGVPQACGETCLLGEIPTQRIFALGSAHLKVVETARDILDRKSISHIRCGRADHRPCIRHLLFILQMLVERDLD